MHDTVLAAFGIASGLINTVAVVPYIRDIFRHETKPERATWWVFLALSAFALVGQVQAGVRWALLMTIADALTAGVIAVCSLWFGYGRLERRDWISLAMAAVGIGISQALRSPLLALLVVIAVDASGLWLTIYKTWEAPYSETLASWVLATVADVCGVIAVGRLDPVQVLYPAYILAANGLLTGVIIVRRPRAARDAVDA